MQDLLSSAKGFVGAGLCDLYWSWGVFVLLPKTLLLGQVVHSGLSCHWTSVGTFSCASWLLLWRVEKATLWKWTFNSCVDHQHLKNWCVGTVTTQAGAFTGSLLHFAPLNNETKHFFPFFLPVLSLSSKVSISTSSQSCWGTVFLAVSCCRVALLLSEVFNGRLNNSINSTCKALQACLFCWMNCCWLLLILISSFQGGVLYQILV